ncbi:MAG: surface-adhesin E family protein [Nitrosospira sp.]
MRYLAAILIAIFSTNSSAEWVQFALGTTGPAYYDKDRIRDLGNGVISVWEKFVVTDDVLKKSLAMDSSFKDYRYTMTRGNINCKEHKFARTAMHAYSTNTSPFFSYYYPEEDIEYIDIVPQSMAEELMTLLCPKK